MSIVESTMTKCQTFFQSLKEAEQGQTHHYSLAWNRAGKKEAEGNCGGGHDPLPGHWPLEAHLWAILLHTVYRALGRSESRGVGE